MDAMISEPRDRYLIRTLIAAVAIALTLALVSSLAPPRNADAMRYHLAQPKEMLQSGLFTVHPYYTYNFPRTFHYLFLIGESLQWPGLSGFMSWIAVFLACIATVKTTRLCLSERAEDVPIHCLAALSFGCLILTPGIFQVASVPTSDGGLMCFFSWGCYIALANLYGTVQKRTKWVLSGVLVGLAAGSKYHGLVIAAAFEAVLLFLLIRQRTSSENLVRGAEPIGYFGHVAALLLAGSPFYLLNLFHFGNPVWPLFADLLGDGDLLTAIALNNNSGIAQTFSIADNVINHIREPFCVNPLIVAGVFCLGSLRTPGARFAVTWTAVGYVVVVLLLTYYPRYLLLAWPQIAVIATCGVVTMYRTAGLRWIARALIGMSIVSGTSFAGIYSADFVKWAVGVNSSEDIRRMSFFYEDYKWLNENLDPNRHRVLAMPASGHSYYLDIPYLRADPGLSGLIDWDRVCTGDCSDMVEWMKNRGITHLFVGVKHNRIDAVVDRLLEKGVIEPLRVVENREVLLQRIKGSIGYRPVGIYKVKASADPSGH